MMTEILDIENTRHTLNFSECLEINRQKTIDYLLNEKNLKNNKLLHFTLNFTSFSNVNNFFISN